VPARDQAAAGERVSLYGFSAGKCLANLWSFTMGTFPAFWVDLENEETVGSVKETQLSDLPEHPVLVEVDCSGVNYKDALAVTGAGKILREFPFIPGIDFAGTVVESADERWTKGDEVVLTGWGVGERHFGGFSKFARVKAEWLVKRPSALSSEQAMITGTAGLTAALCVQALLDAGLTPESGTIAVSGASGGVGSFAIALLTSIGFKTAAISSKTGDTYLQSLGASQLLTLEEMSAPPRPLEKQRFAGAIDTVGNLVLARLLAEVDYGGTVAACGLAGGAQLPTTVMPFILRGVRLQGIDSVMCPSDRRQTAWELVATHIKLEMFHSIHAGSIKLERINQVATDIIGSRHKGRYTVKL